VTPSWVVDVVDLAGRRHGHVDRSGNIRASFRNRTDTVNKRCVALVQRMCAWGPADGWRVDRRSVLGLPSSCLGDDVRQLHAGRRGEAGREAC
jgi:hypothetical protein